MFRLSLNLLRCKSTLETLPFTNLGSLNKLISERSLSSFLIGGKISTPTDFRVTPTTTTTRSIQVQPVRNGSKYVVGDLSPLWYRRRRKAMTQRLKVLNPSTPVIEQMTPLPLTNEGRYPSYLFGSPEVNDLVKEEEEMKGVMAEINRKIEGTELGRLFAVINLMGKQFKVTPEDIIIVQGYWAPNVGDRLRLHKILLVGGSDFTLLGRPLLDNNLIRVEATVIEKTLSYTKLHFRLKKRKNFRRLKFFKDPYTMLRINMIELNSV